MKVLADVVPHGLIKTRETGAHKAAGTRSASSEGDEYSGHCQPPRPPGTGTANAHREN